MADVSAFLLIDIRAFFDRVRAPLFRGALSPSQVAGLNALLDRWTAGYHAHDERWLAYVLATAHHETAQTMQPIAEYGRGRGRPYGVPDKGTGQTYYGRGYVQLTWRANYAKQGARLGVDLVAHPDLAMVPANAAAIAFNGMIAGDFTGKKLADYLGDATDDPVGARRIINGTDCADRIAGYYGHYLSALGL